MRVLLPLMLMAACRPDPGKPDYQDPPPLAPTETNPDFLGGETPFDAEVPRASLSVFYEGDFSEQYLIDDLTAFYFIWENTFSQVSDDYRVEGLVSDRLDIGSVGWWGGGVSWDVATDISAWTRLHLCAASASAAVADFDVLMASGITEFSVPVADHGFVNDGAWHCMSIPLSDFVGVDLTAVTAPFSVVGDTGDDGDSVFIDDVYLTVDP